MDEDPTAIVTATAQGDVPARDQAPPDTPPVVQDDDDDEEAGDVAETSDEVPPNVAPAERAGAGNPGNAGDTGSATGSGNDESAGDFESDGSATEAFVDDDVTPRTFVGDWLAARAAEWRKERRRGYNASASCANILQEHPDLQLDEIVGLERTLPPEEQDENIESAIRPIVTLHHEIINQMYYESLADEIVRQVEKDGVSFEEAIAEFKRDSHLDEAELEAIFALASTRLRVRNRREPI